RADLVAKNRMVQSVEKSQENVSRIAGHLWNKMLEGDKAVWHGKAQMVKAQHGQKFPGYRFSP
ncbi:hypothetical protein B0H13DRAFT_1499645, partial [Mycena leptocephala]